jgi:hypothetical protein
MTAAARTAYGRVESSRLPRRRRGLVAPLAASGTATTQFGITASFDIDNGCRFCGSRLNCGDSAVLLVDVDGPQLVGLHGHSPNVTQHNVQEAGERLQEEEEKKFAGLMTRRAQLQHLMEKLRGLPSTQGLHGVDLLHTLELCEIVVVTQSLLDGLVRILLWRVGHQIQDGPQALLGQGIADQVKLHLLVFDVPQEKP